jgi:hypothetical protein
MSRSTQSAAPLWPVIYGLGLVALSIFLFALRAGIAMIILWIYFNVRTTQKNDMKFVTPCKCAICNHEKASMSLEQKCACCIH